MVMALGETWMVFNRQRYLKRHVFRHTVGASAPMSTLIILVASLEYAAPLLHPLLCAILLARSERQIPRHQEQVTKRLARLEAREKE